MLTSIRGHRQGMEPDFDSREVTRPLSGFLRVAMVRCPALKDFRRLRRSATLAQCEVAGPETTAPETTGPETTVQPPRGTLKT